jgi:hypothetical protein
MVVSSGDSEGLASDGDTSSVVVSGSTCVIIVVSVGEGDDSESSSSLSVTVGEVPSSLSDPSFCCEVDVEYTAEVSLSISSVPVEVEVTESDFVVSSLSSSVSVEVCDGS